MTILAIKIKTVGVKFFSLNHTFQEEEFSDFDNILHKLNDEQTFYFSIRSENNFFFKLIYPLFNFVLVFICVRLNSFLFDAK